MDGIIVERIMGPEKFRGVLVNGGRLRLQNCAVGGVFACGIDVAHGADPTILRCRYAGSSNEP